MGVCNCQCTGNNFTCIQEVIDFLNSEEELLNLKSKEIEFELLKLDILQKKDLIELDITIKNVTNTLSELSYFLSRVYKKYNPKKVNDIFEIVQNELLEMYFNIKRHYFPSFVYKLLIILTIIFRNQKNSLILLQSLLQVT